jgi:hypothetical protein
MSTIKIKVVAREKKKGIKVIVIHLYIYKLRGLGRLIHKKRDK